MCKKRSHPLRTRKFSESYGLYHVTAASHAEPEKNGATFKEAITALKKGKIDTYIDTIMYYNIKTHYVSVHTDIILLFV